MKIDEILEEIDEILIRAWSLPLSGGKILIDANLIRESLDEIKDSLPNELRQAKAIVADRSDIINDAKREAQIVISSSEEKAKSIVEHDELVKQAKIRAHAIISEAESKSKEIRHAASSYLEDIMKQTDEFLTNNLAEFRKARKHLKSSL
jgi:hypothetical protein